MKSSELCDKEFSQHSKFSAGIYSLGIQESYVDFEYVSLGCGCDKNITLGFELMIDREGPKNLFRILQCRDVDMDALEGILVDHACLLDAYILNREAEILEWKLLLVDGAHWRGMKKLKKTR